MTNDNSYSGKVAYRGDVASNYERDRVHEPLWAIEQKWMESWAANVSEGSRILDVPTGTGRFVGIFLARGAKVTAIDVSADMLAELRRRWPPDGQRLVVEQADAESLPYESDSFDYVVSWRLFHLLPPAAAERVLSELARVCRGELIIEVFGVRMGNRFAISIKSFLARIRQKLARRMRGAAELEKPWSHITNYSHLENALLTLFQRCGLRVVRSETLTSYANAPARIYFLRRGGPAQ